MLKYGNIIGRLTEAQKVTLLTDLSCLSSREFKSLGLPELNIADVEKYTRGVYPNPSSLANSFDAGLVSRVAADAAFAAAADGTDILLTPPAKAKLEPYRTMLSEDPMLSSILAGAYVSSANSGGLSPCISDYCIRDSEVAWLDQKPDSRVVYNFAVKPNALAVSAGGAAVMSSGIFDNAEYKETNFGLISDVASGFVYGASYSIVKQASEEDTVELIKRGVVCLKGDALALENAIKQYEIIKKQIDKGEETVTELEEAEREGRVFSPEMLDSAADRIIDFVMNMRRKYAVTQPYIESRDLLSLISVKESAVLLKNEEKLLPLKKKSKLCVIGDIAMQRTVYGTTDAERLAALLASKGYSVSGFARGYDMSRDRSDNLIAEAVTLAKDAEQVLLFLGTDAAREINAPKFRSLELPANQVALATALAKFGKKIIAVVSSALSFDIAPVENFGALLLLTLGTKFSADAVADILSGEFNPSGRLANTLYRNTEESFKKQRQYRLSGNVKSGPFVGYRYYDTAGLNVGFPFGHGLSYTTFSYSKAKISGNRVSVTVKNTGKIAGCETVQFYIGLADSAVLRPQKELMAVEKVMLKPGESRTVAADIRIPEIFDAESRQIITEAGEYTIYVGSSVANADHTVKYRAGSLKLKPQKEPLYKYLQSESNIIAEKYTLEAKYVFMKKSLKNMLSGIALLVLAAALQVYCHIAGVDGNFLNLLSLALVAVAAVFFVTEMIDRQNAKKQAELESAAANNEYFKEAETMQVFSTERMFDTEFDETKDNDASNNAHIVEDLSGEYLKYVDKSFDFAAAAREFDVFASERGYKFEADTINGIFAAFASSRMILVDGLNDADFKGFMYLLCEYFESALYIDPVDASYTHEDSLLFFVDAEGRRYKRTALLAIESANTKKHTLHLAAMTNVTVETLPKYIIPFAKYVKNPNSYNSISTTESGNGKQSYYIPPNMWFIMNLAPNQTFDAVPTFISEIATVNTVAFRRTERAQAFSSVHKFYYYQMDYLSERVTAKYEIDEENWKKYDAFAEFVAKHAEYGIGNKQWICLERYIAAFVAAGGETESALDNGFAAKVLPSALTALDGCDGRDDIDLIDAINVIFGEERMDVTRDAIKNFAKNKAAKTEQGAL